jgi:cell division protein FtsX
LKVEYYPKEKALKLFQRSVPEVVKAFKKYGIDNPLPDTIYIVVSNQNQYEFLKEVMNDYKDIILNIEDINK